MAYFVNKSFEPEMKVKTCSKRTKSEAPQDLSLLPCTLLPRSDPALSPHLRPENVS